MMNKSRKQTRLKGYDYSGEGCYFVTICSKARQNIFGEITAVGAGLASARYEIKLSKLGQIVYEQWRDIPNQYKNMKIDQSIVMPNHFHGILVVDSGIERADVQDRRADARPAPTVSDVVCSFKSRCAVEYLKYIRQNNLDVSGAIWQRGFYDHVIRNEHSLNEIREYILNNPVKWDDDENNTTIAGK